MDGLTLPMFPVNCLRREVSDTPLAVTRRVKGTTLPIFLNQIVQCSLQHHANQRKLPEPAY